MLVAVAMVLCEDSLGLVELALTDKLAWRLGQQPQEQQLYAGHEALQPGRQPPLKITREVLERAKRGPRRDDGAQVPQRVVDGRSLAAVAWVGDLGDEQWARAVGYVGSEADDESSDEIHGVWVVCRRKCLQQGTKQNEKTADCHSCPSAQTVGDVWCKDQHEQAPKAGHGPEDTQAAARWVAEDYTKGQKFSRAQDRSVWALTVPPGLHGLESVEQAPVVAKRGGTKEEEGHHEVELAELSLLSPW